jgi:hypothetical protein
MADTASDRGPGETRGEPARFSWRAPVAVLLIVAGCVFAPLSVVAVWTANQVSNTDRFVANMAPLIHEPAIQHALTDKITTEITSRLKVQGLADQASASLTQHGLDGQELCCIRWRGRWPVGWRGSSTPRSPR